MKVNNYFGRVGKDISAASNINEAIAQAGLGFSVALEKVFDARGNEIPSTFNVARADTGESLGVNGSRYTPVQTENAFSYLDNLANQLPLRFHRGGMLKGGRFFISVEFEAMNLAGDTLSSFGVFLSSFDGSWANRFVSVFNRAACMNLCSYVAREGRDAGGIIAKHTENASIKLDNFVSQLLIARSAQKKLFSRFQAENFSIGDMDRLATALFPKESKQAENARGVLVNAFNSSRFGTFGATKWDAFNAVTFFETHESQRRATSRASQEENAFDALVSQRSLATRAADLLAN